jgi:hypothetical protein
MTQCGARIFELEQQGCKIRHESRPGERLVFYVLESEPAEPKPLPSFCKKQRRVSGDWFTEATGRSRATGARLRTTLFSNGRQPTPMGYFVREQGGPSVYIFGESCPEEAMAVVRCIEDFAGGLSRLSAHARHSSPRNGRNSEGRTKTNSATRILALP